jgi:hypothetical protein
MLTAVEDYRNGKISLRDLTTELDSHYWPLLGKPAEWRRQLRSQWVTLEEVRMVTLFHYEWHIESYCRAVVDRAMPSIANLINDALRSTQDGATAQSS